MISTDPQNDIKTHKITTIDAQNDVFRPEKLHLYTHKTTLLDPQNDFLSYIKLQLYTRRIKSLNQQNDNRTAAQTLEILWRGGGAKLGNNCVKVSNLFGLLGLLGILGLLSLFGLLGLLSH